MGERYNGGLGHAAGCYIRTISDLGAILVQRSSGGTRF